MFKEVKESKDLVSCINLGKELSCLRRCVSEDKMRGWEEGGKRRARRWEKVRRKGRARRKEKDGQAEVTRLRREQSRSQWLPVHTGHGEGGWRGADDLEEGI